LQVGCLIRSLLGIEGIFARALLFGSRRLPQVDMDDAHQVSKCLLKCPQGNSFDFSTIFSEFEVDSIVSFPLGPNWSDSYVLSTFSS